jgi:hypothetical protein
MFKKLQEQVQSNFKKLQQSGPVFIIDVDKEEIWNKYLDGFKESDRQSNVCRCCQSFMRQFAGIVGITDKFEVKTIWDDISWDFEGAAEYKNSVESIDKWIKSHPISDVFLHSEKHCGNNKSFDPKRDLTWYHYHLELPSNLVNKGGVDTVKGDKRANKEVLKRSLDELTIDATETTLELIAQNSLYRGNEHKATLDAFLAVQKQYKELKNNKSKENFCWVKSNSLSPAVSRIKNTAIGTLLVNISEGMELDKAVAAFERVVAPANYKRPTAVITPRMIEDAQKRLQELGLENCLNRRQITEKDLSAAENGVLYVNRKSQKVNSNVFDAMKGDLTVHPKTLSKVSEMSIADFLEKVVPTAKNIQVLVENRHVGNFMTLLGPDYSDSDSEDKSKNLFKWDNLYSWSYTGSVADSIRERVKEAGGNVEGKLRVSLSWANYDDLDLHCHGPSNHIYYGCKGIAQKCGGTLDVDKNAGSGTTRTPVENIFWKNDPNIGGIYRIVVNQFMKRETVDTGFEVEVEYDGQVWNFSKSQNGLTSTNHPICEFSYTKKDGFKMITDGDSSLGKYHSQTKWGVKTGQWIDVSHILLSPNHWNAPTGNKHYFFIIDGCKSDEDSRAFFNEYLKQELDKDRKVFEVLAGKIKVGKVEDGARELSGVGFSETVRNELIVKVSGKFDSIIRVKF